MFRFLLVAILAVLAVPSVFAQSAPITSKKVVYKRKGKDVPDHKRTFEVNYPVFGDQVSPAVRGKLEAGTDYWRIFEMTLADNLNDEWWLESLDHIVKYNKNWILDIWLIAEGSAAYPDGAIRYLVFNNRTGERLTIEDLFAKDKMPGLLEVLRKKMRSAEDKAIAENEEVRATIDWNRELVPEKYPTPERLEFKHLEGFTVSDEGVTFIYDYGFPHVAQALEPGGEFTLTYAELKPFIRRDGLLAGMVR